MFQNSFIFFLFYGCVTWSLAVGKNVDVFENKMRGRVFGLEK